jgi:DNA invertase Pin-like site-specific DNA recombinase
MFGYTVSAVYRDDGPATVTTRTGLDARLADVSIGQVARVLVADHSRLGRRPVDVKRTVASLEGKGVVIEFAGEVVRDWRLHGEQEKQG